VLETTEPPGSLKDGDVAHDVRRHIGVGIDQRVADPGLRRQVHHPGGRTFVIEQCEHRGLVGDIHRPEPETGMRRQLRQPCLL